MKTNMNQISVALSKPDQFSAMLVLGFESLGDDDSSKELFYHPTEKFYVQVDNSKLEFFTFCQNNRGEFG